MFRVAIVTNFEGYQAAREDGMDAAYARGHTYLDQAAQITNNTSITLTIDPDHQKVERSRPPADVCINCFQPNAEAAYLSTASHSFERESERESEREYFVCRACAASFVEKGGKLEDFTRKVDVLAKVSFIVHEDKNEYEEDKDLGESNNNNNNNDDKSDETSSQESTLSQQAATATTRTQAVNILYWNNDDSNHDRLKGVERTSIAKAAFFFPSALLEQYDVIVVAESTGFGNDGKMEKFVEHAGFKLVQKHLKNYKNGSPSTTADCAIFVKSDWAAYTQPVVGNSNRFVVIKIALPNCDPLHVLGVHLQEQTNLGTVANFVQTVNKIKPQSWCAIGDFNTGATMLPPIKTDSRDAAWASIIAPSALKNNYLPPRPDQLYWTQTVNPDRTPTGNFLDHAFVSDSLKASAVLGRLPHTFKSFNHPALTLTVFV